ncbi:MAG TPA: glycosyltransferase family 2 protein [Opitutus sp.]|nr:glycosyltransferase family 2 protein [Opitutus sp.]
MIERPKIPAVVVTYHPADTVTANLSAMVRESGEVIVVDNGSSPQAHAAIESVRGVTLLALGENLGVAAALNRGAEAAAAAGAGWMVAFDQDSVPEPGMIAALWAAHARMPRAAVIGPRILEDGAVPSRYRWVRRHPHWPGLFQRVPSYGEDLAGVTMLITSGSLIELAAWRELGGFDERLFIDYIDTDYCLRTIRAEREVAVAGAAVLRHRLGERRDARIGGMNFRPTHHAAFRHYYMSRNRILMWRRHARAVPHWAAFDAVFAAYNFVRVLLFENERAAKIKAMAAGTWAGLCGRSGRMP